ncbi:Aste57867_17873 [Aphanomyces stellatus]|uniref:Aste57867_17873 protein n=1 Tax=Aphanomyces stellatus TaxID=120398 RepID=A0A485L8Z4_9STRA|nr:hypothetical protein As57867_017812 [Aphanomyces stellatus]VFT94616.1 Aste57867_17873 [Aphanomyces stellatus]
MFETSTKECTEFAKMLAACKRVFRVPAAARIRGLTTYSGGHPSEGQGGFYGSLKTRSEGSAKFTPGYRAEASDIGQLHALMERANDANFLHIVADNETQELIGRLFFKGSPVWGLSLEERAFVSKLRLAPKP